MTKIVKSVDVEDEEGFLITVENGSETGIPLRPTDYATFETLECRSRDGRETAI